MEMKIVKSRPPDIRLKKHAEVKIHKKDFLPSTNQKKEVFSARKPDFSFQKIPHRNIAGFDLSYKIISSLKL